MLCRLSPALVVCCAAFAPCAFSAPQPINIDLVSVYNDAVANNADLAAARADYQARKEIVPQARAGLLPNVSAGATVSNTRVEIDQPSITSNRSGNAYQANLTQPVFRADRWFQLGAAEEINEQAALLLSATEQQLILLSAENYFGVLRAQDNLATTKAQEAAFKRQFDQSKERFAAGVADKTDMLQAQASFDSSRANRIVAQRRVDDAFEALTTLTNRTYSALQGIVHSIPILAPSPSNATQWVNTAVEQNLSLQASQYAVGAAEQTVKQRKAGHAPTLDVVARYQKGDNDSLGFTNPNELGTPFKGDVSQRSISLQLNVPLYSGGLISSKVLEASARLDQSEQQLEGQRRRVVESTRSLYRAVATDVEQTQARRQSIISNQNAVEATETGYRVGTRNIVDVLDAERQLYSSVYDYNNTRYDYILDNLRLKQTVGSLSPGDLQALMPYLKRDYNPDTDYLPPGLSNSDPSNLFDSSGRNP